MPIGTTSAMVAAVPDLSTIRKRKGISLAEIATNTKISTRYLEAIEQSEFDLLPGGVFNTSYIRQYARAIDYDEWDLLAHYDALTRPVDETPIVRPRSRLLGLLRVPAPITRLFASEKRV
jgi:cytoskeletal protein RodZ